MHNKPNLNQLINELDTGVFYVSLLVSACADGFSLNLLFEEEL